MPIVEGNRLRAFESGKIETYAGHGRPTRRLPQLGAFIFPRRCSTTKQPAWPKLGEALAGYSRENLASQILLAGAKLIAGRLDQLGHPREAEPRAWLARY